MARQLDEEPIDLDELRARLSEADLIPSQKPLLDDIERRFARLDQAGVSSLAELQRQLRSPNLLEAVAETSKVDADYLVLLNPAIRGFFPKPRALKNVAWLDEGVVSCLIDAGIKNTDQFAEAACGCPKLCREPVTRHFTSGGEQFGTPGGACTLG